MGSIIYKPKARVDAFLVLYQWEMKGEDIESLMEDYIQHSNITYSEHRRYVRKLVRTYFQNAKEVDKIISENLENWSLDRLGYVERNILRVATTEFMFINIKRPKEVLSDYIKITVKYAGKNSARFVHGVLAKIISLKFQDLT